MPVRIILLIVHTSCRNVNFAGHSSSFIYTSLPFAALTPGEVCKGVLTVTLMAFIAAGIFIVGFALVWLVIYLITIRSTQTLNRRMSR